MQEVVELVVPVYGLGVGFSGIPSHRLKITHTPLDKLQVGGSQHYGLIGIILIEVDDLMLAGSGRVYERLLKALSERFEFANGKSAAPSSTVAG